MYLPAKGSRATALLLQPALLDGILLHLEAHEHLLFDDGPTPLPALPLVALHLQVALKAKGRYGAVTRYITGLYKVAAIK